MGDKITKSPHIRFAGFTDDWEQRKLEYFVDDYLEKTTVENQYPVLTSSQKQGIVLQEEYFANRQVTTEKNIGYFILPRGYFTFRSRTDNGIFAFNRNDIVDYGIISYFYPVFSIKNGDSNFFLQFLNYSIRRDVNLAAEGTGQRVLSLKKFKGIKIVVPTIDEQQKIGECFYNLDNLITLHQRKLDLLKVTKKSMLQKMFPKDGESVPEIRFAGFTDAWEQRKLSELTSLITKGTTPLNKSGNGKINYVKIESIDSSSGKITITSTISEEEHNGYLKRSQLQEGDVLFSIAGTLGRVTAVNKDVLPANTNQALAIIRLKNCNLNYIITYLKGKAVSEFVKKNPTVGAQPNLSLEQVGNLEIALPKTDEQEQIGDFFFNLDNLITLHQRELDLLKELKKSMLKQMFI